VPKLLLGGRGRERGGQGPHKSGIATGAEQPVGVSGGARERLAGSGKPGG